MSFRTYPTFIKGAPKLRIFLPNFWMKLIKPKEDCPPNQVHFMCPLEMTAHDVKSYIEKIYKTEVVQVKSLIVKGELKNTHKNYIIKDPDYRVATVILPDGVTFQYPDLFPKEKQNKKNEDEQNLLKQARGLMKQRRKNWDRENVPSWFGI